MAKFAVCASVLLVLLLAQSESKLMKSCCTQYIENPIPVKLLKSYTIQEITGFCNIRAVIFRTVKNKLICANPDIEWVKKAMKTVPKILND